MSCLLNTSPAIAREITIHVMKRAVAEIVEVIAPPNILKRPDPAAPSTASIRWPLGEHSADDYGDILYLIFPKKVDIVKHKISISVFYIQPGRDNPELNVCSAGYRKLQI